MKKSAIISECGRYRYELSRIWDAATAPVLFIMLNPSTADAEMDDPTIRRCIGFAKKWNMGGIIVGNLFAYRATKPEDLWALKYYERGDDRKNARHLIDLVCRASLVVCAWGNEGNNCSGLIMDQLYELQKVTPFICLGKTKSGQPRHPLYTKKDTELSDYIIDNDADLPF